MANGPTDAEVTEAVFVRDENPEDIESLYKDILNKASPEQLSRSNKKLASAEEAERSRKKKEPEGGRRNYDHSKDFLEEYHFLNLKPQIFSHLNSLSLL